MRMKVVQKTAPAPSKKFTRNKNYHHSDSNSHPQYLHATTVYLLRPPRSLSSDRPWIILPIKNSDGTVVFRHPLTSKPLLFNLPRDFDFSKLHPSAIAVSYQIPVCDKLVVVPTPRFYSRNSVDARECTLLALYNGGRLRGCPPAASSPWVELFQSEELDDIAVYGGKIYTVSRHGILKLINSYNNLSNISKTLIFQSVNTGPLRGWRKRLVVDDKDLLLVVRTDEKVFRVFRFKRGVKGYCWDEIWGFKGNNTNKVLFMAKDYYFFRRASRKFPGKEYKNCIVFHAKAFPLHGYDCFEFRKRWLLHEYDDDIAVFRLDDGSFAREDEWENSGFPKINWSPPSWIFRASSVPVPAYEFQCRSTSVSSCQLEREPDEAKGLDSVNRDENDGEVQSDLKVSNSKDKEKQQEMKSEFGNQDQEQGVESDSDSQDQEDGKMQCDSDGHGKHDGGMHSKTNIEGDMSLQEDTVTTFPAVEEAATKTLVTMNNGNGATEQETSGKNITHWIPKPLTSSMTEIHKTDSTTTKFEGLDIRSDLIPALQKIWRKHGNIIKYSFVRNSDIIAKALESLATMIRILEDNSAQSLTDNQADYLSSTLSDLRCIGFKVDWLACFVEKALIVHTSKGLVESLNNLSQSSSRVKERKAILLDELAKLNDDENKLKEKMAKVSKMILFIGQVKFNEPIGVGLT